MLKVTQQQRDNALYALNVMWPAVPPQAVAPALECWNIVAKQAGVSVWPVPAADISKLSEPEKLSGNTPHCGTFACFGGFVAVDPYFVALGVERHPSSGAPQYKGLTAYNAAQALFGECYLFEPRGLYPTDRLEESDHEVVTLRLKALIAGSEVSE